MSQLTFLTQSLVNQENALLREFENASHINNLANRKKSNINPFFHKIRFFFLFSFCRLPQDILFEMTKKFYEKKIRRLAIADAISDFDAAQLLGSLDKRLLFQQNLSLWFQNATFIGISEERKNQYANMMQKKMRWRFLDTLESDYQRLRVQALLENSEQSLVNLRKKLPKQFDRPIFQWKKKRVVDFLQRVRTLEWLEAIRPHIPDHGNIKKNYNEFYRSIVSKKFFGANREIAGRKFHWSLMRYRKKNKVKLPFYFLIEATSIFTNLTGNFDQFAQYIQFKHHLKESETALISISNTMDEIYHRMQRKDGVTSESPEFKERLSIIQKNLIKLENWTMTLIGCQNLLIQSFFPNFRYAYAFHYGRLKRIFRRMNDQINTFLSDFMKDDIRQHEICGCDYAYRGEPSNNTLTNPQEIDVVQGLLDLEKKERELRERIESLQRENFSREEEEKLQRIYHVCCKALEYRRQQDNSGQHIGCYEKGLRPTVLLATCDYGTGHRTAAEAVIRYMGKLAAHVRVINPSNSFFNRFSPVYWLGRLFKRSWNSATWFNYTLKKQWYRYQNIQRKLMIWVHKLLGRNWPAGVARKDPFGSGYRKNLLRQHALMDLPDLFLTTYHMDLNPIREIAEEFTTPCGHWVTDFHVKAGEVEHDGNPPEFPYFKYFLPNKSPEIMKTIRPLSPQNYEFTGFPVRPEFLEMPDEAERMRMKEIRGIEPERKVVLIMSGGGGQSLPYAEHLLRSKTWKKKIHIVVVAGNNTAHGRHIKRVYESSKNPYVTLEIAEDLSTSSEKNPFYVGPKVLSEFMQISDVVVTKSGGVSTAEILYQEPSVPILFDHRQPLLSWERVNVKTVTDAGRGLSCRSMKSFEKDLMATIALGRKTGDLSLSMNNSKKAFAKVMKNLTENCFSNPDVRKKRDSYLSFSTYL